ncbi:Hypothetical predicted protein, partial [Paramuricea clavata]
MAGKSTKVTLTEFLPSTLKTPGSSPRSKDYAKQRSNGSPNYTNPLLEAIRIPDAGPFESKAWLDFQLRVSGNLCNVKRFLGSDQKVEFIVASHQVRPAAKKIRDGTNEGDILYITFVSDGGFDRYLLIGMVKLLKVFAFDIICLKADYGRSNDLGVVLHHLMPLFTDVSILKIITDRDTDLSITSHGLGNLLKSKFYLKHLWQFAFDVKPIGQTPLYFNNKDACFCFKKRQFFLLPADELVDPSRTDELFYRKAARNPNFVQLKRRDEFVKNFLFASSMSSSLAILWFSKVCCEALYIEKELRKEILRKNGVVAIVQACIQYYRSTLIIPSPAPINNPWGPLFPSPGKGKKQHHHGHGK